MRNTIILACVAGGFTVQAQRVLHFTVTSGFDHGTREVSYALFQSIGLDLGITVDDAPTAGAFNDAGTLALYDAIVFSNTSGNAILNDEQRANFEEWSMNGGHVMGIHAASDTYRHSTANGNNTGTWDFYAELIGASVQEDPNHVSGTPPYELMHIGTHPSISNLPDPWLKNEEYYYWEGGYFNPDNNVVLQVEETIGPNGLVNSYDAPRPMSWYRELPSGSRIFYTALGHAASNYTEDALFRQHIEDALIWMLFGTTAISSTNDVRPFTLVNDGLSVTISTSQPNGYIRVIDPTGRLMHAASSNGHHRIDVGAWPDGIYFFTVGQHTRPVLIAH
ncbi:MAG TPA: ThuA domain-containing protein [Flavobacteriales bacterium]|nr:ThuA domain-containing protein [Flavobacteriales bacterium]